MPESPQRLQKARELIIQKRYDDARAILETIPNDQTAITWLKKLDEIAPAALPSRPARKRPWAALALGVPLLLLALVGGALLIRPFLSSDNNTPTPQIAAINPVESPVAATPSAIPLPTQTPSMTPWPSTATLQPMSLTQPDLTTTLDWRAAPITLYYVTSPMANIRACASTTCQIVSQVQYRESVSVIETVSGDSLQGNAMWMHLNLGSAEGYIHNSVVSTTLPPRPTATPIPVARETATVTRIIDGDTIDVRMNGQTYRVRYIGINTPELDQPCYGDATNANSRLVRGQTVTLVKDVSNTDQYGRLLRYVYVGSVFVNAELVAGGWAEARSYPPDTTQYSYLQGLENTAHNANLGCHRTGVFD